MKNFKIVLFVVLVFQLNLHAQLPVKTSKYNSNLKTKIVGSPYTQKMFAQAKVGTVEQKTSCDIMFSMMSLNLFQLKKTL